MYRNTDARNGQVQGAVEELHEQRHELVFHIQQRRGDEAGRQLSEAAGEQEQQSAGGWRRRIQALPRQQHLGTQSQR